jgi:hypothetical protein
MLGASLVYLTICSSIHVHVQGWIFRDDFFYLPMDFSLSLKHLVLQNIAVTLMDYKIYSFSISVDTLICPESTWVRYMVVFLSFRILGDCYYNKSGWFNCEEDISYCA